MDAAEQDEQDERTYRDNVARAEELAHKSVDGDYGEEPFRLRLATAAGAHATVALAAATRIHARRTAEIGEVLETRVVQ